MNGYTIAAAIVVVAVVAFLGVAFWPVKKEEDQKWTTNP